MDGGVNNNGETTGWLAALSKPFTSFFNSSMDTNTDMVSSLADNQQQQDEMDVLVAPAPPAPINHVDKGKVADWLYFCIKIRLEGKHGKILLHILISYVILVPYGYHFVLCSHIMQYTNYIMI